MATPFKKNEFGKKARQTSGSENKVLPFSDWLRSFDGKGIYSSDIDFVQWRFKDNKPVPVGIIEATRVNVGITVNATYLNNILKRYTERDFQGRAARYVSEKLGCKAWIVLFREDVSEFWVYNLTDNVGFNRALSSDEMQIFINGMDVE